MVAAGKFNTVGSSDVSFWLYDSQPRVSDH